MEEVSDLIAATVLDSFLTHADPRCVAACVLNNLIIEGCLRANAWMGHQVLTLWK